MTVAIIGGTGFHQWAGFVPGKALSVTTKYSPRPVEVTAGELNGREFVFVPRHGSDHQIPPHRVNYRANIKALHELEVNAVIAIAAVGGINADAVPGSLMIPDQILDYTCGRAHTFFDGEDGVVAHADMTEPYCEALRRRLIDAAATAGVAAIDGGTYAATQGPRFETAAEIRRLQRDGADVVGMTGMPEAALAKELRLAYAAIALIVNPAAGKGKGMIDAEAVQAALSSGRAKVERLLSCAVPAIHGEEFAVPPPVMP